MTTNTPIALSAKSQESFLAFYWSVHTTQNTDRMERRSYFERVDRAYQRESNRTQEHLDAKRANRTGDAHRYQDITVPVVMPQVEAAVTYQTSVFLTGYPLFGVVADPAYMDEALMLESVIEEQAARGGWPRELILFFRNGMKYNFSALEVDWSREVTYTIETDLTKSATEGVPKETIWEGNSIKNLDVYNTFVDPRVAPADVPTKGEFAGYTEFVSRIELKQYVAELPDKIIANIPAAFKSGTATNSAQSSSSSSYFVPLINPDVTIVNQLRGGTNWLQWAGLSDNRNKNLEYKDAYELTTIYCKILPSEFNLHVPSSGTPQIYKLVVVNHQVIIYCELQTNAHGMLPILIGQPLEDGLRYQTKSLAENGQEFQEVTTAYMSSIMASRRRAISDRTLYDPSRITSANINSANPSAKIPVRPGAYGKTVSDAVYAFPYREDQAATSMQQVQGLIGMSNQLSGQNRVSQGQFQKGNKTLKEFDDTMSNANGRDQLASILLEHQIFMPLKFIVKINILQYQGGTKVYNRDAQKQVEVDPIALRKAVLEFKISDGIIPSSKLINADSFATGLQAISTSPQIGSGYNVGPMFSYLMKTQGADLSPFEKSQSQMAYEQALQSWQQIAQLAVEKDQDIANLPPQPLPADFGYDPEANNPAPKETTESASPSGQSSIA
jgi:hypothetical protein